MLLLLLGCAFFDFNLPHLRKTTKQNENVSEDYKKMIPVISKNLLVSFPFFHFFEYYLLKTPNIKDNVYNYPLIFYVLAWMFLGDIFFYTIGHYIFLDFIIYIRLIMNLIILMVWGQFIVVLLRWLLLIYLLYYYLFIFGDTKKFGSYYDIRDDILDSFYVT